MSYTRIEALKEKRRRLCAQCYAPLVSIRLQTSDELYILICSDGCGDAETVGNVTVFWAIQEGQKRLARAHEIRFRENLLRDRSDFNADEAIRKLGY